MNTLHSLWQPDQLVRHASPPVGDIFSHFNLDTLQQFPDAAQLNRLIETQHGQSWVGPTFIDQGDVAVDECRYYEAIIGEDNRVPTREKSFHDLFNALIWLTFPRTKQRLNQLHMIDIAAEGAHPRTARRNRVTHFDECGVVLAVPAHKLREANTLLTMLDEHHWHAAFYEAREAWGEILLPRIFGHANLEMMLSPFVGLTGKWLAVVVPENFAQYAAQEQDLLLDHALAARVAELHDFEHSGILKPLPLLGVPGWAEAQSPAFYANRDYFRPRRPSMPDTVQLPLTFTAER